MMHGLFGRLRARVRAQRAARITSRHAAARAARGAAYLDGVDPAWFELLDADALALADGGACVLGQLHGEFRHGLWRARLVDGTSAPRASLSPVAYGFLAVPAGDPSLEARDYAYLDAAWRAEIAARRSRRKSVPSEAVTTSAVVPEPVA